MCCISCLQSNACTAWETTRIAISEWYLAVFMEQMDISYGKTVLINKMLLLFRNPRQLKN